MYNYLQLCAKVLKQGVMREDRTGTGTIALFGESLRFDLSKGFPAVTTKALHIKSIWHELMWMLSGSENISYLQENGVKIWNPWADENGNLGPVYGVQWRNWYDKGSYIDQLNNVIQDIKSNPTSRRHMVTAWNPGDIPYMKLPPCHYAYQFFVAGGKLSCMVIMRSVDLFLGAPFDIASYATLTHIVAQLTDLEPGDLVFSFGDTHIYLNHVDQVRLQLNRTPLPQPQLYIKRKFSSIDDVKYEDFELVNYNHHPRIKGDISV